MDFKVFKAKLIEKIKPYFGSVVSKEERNLVAAILLADNKLELMSVFNGYRAQSGGGSKQHIDIYNLAMKAINGYNPSFANDVAENTLLPVAHATNFVVDKIGNAVSSVFTSDTTGSVAFGALYTTRLNDAMKKAFPGFNSSIKNYQNYGSYGDLLMQNPSMTTEQLVSHMKGDEELARFADNNGWVGTRSEADPRGLESFTNYVISEYAKKNGGHANANTVVNEDGIGRTTLASFARSYFNAWWSIKTPEKKQDVTRLIETTLFPGSSSTSPTPTSQLIDLKAKLKDVISSYNGKMIDGPEQILAREVAGAPDKTTIRDAFVKFAQATKDLSYDDGTDRVGLISKAAAVLGTTIPVPMPGSRNDNFAEYTTEEINRFYYAITNGVRQVIPDGEMVDTFIAKGNGDGWSRDQMISAIRDYALSTKAITQDEYNRQVAGNTLPNNFFGFTEEEVNGFYRFITSGKVDSIPDKGMLQDIVNKGNSNGWSRDEMIATVRDYALSTNAITQDEYNSQAGGATASSPGGSVAPRPTADLPGGSGQYTANPNESTPGSTSPHKFRLIRGGGSPAGANQLRDNGNAVFLVSSSGELFHVTEQLAQEMQSDGSWSEPEVLSQDQVNGMTLRASLNHTSELGVLTVPSGGEYFLIRGTGAHLSESQLAGNGDAVYAIDRNGNKYHVTGAVAEQMQKAGTWMEPAILDQGTVDGIPLRGALASAGGGATDLSIPVGNFAVVPSTGMGSAVPGTSFRLVRGDGPGLGNSQLKGNGAAVYAVFDDGRKLHVTGTMAEELKKNGKWVEPTIMNQAELDKNPPTGVLASTSGDSKPLEVQFEVPGASSGASNSVSNPVVSSFKLVRGGGPNLGTKQLIGNGAAVYAVFDDGRKLHVTAAMAEKLVQEGKWKEPELMDQGELDKTPVAGTLADSSGRVGALEVPLLETPLPSSGGTRHMETMPTIIPDNPSNSSSNTTSTPKPARDEDWVVDRTGEKRDLYDPKYGYDSVQERIEVKNHIYQGKGTFQELDQIAAIYDSKDPKRIDDWERFSHTGKYAPGATPDVAPVAVAVASTPAPSTPVNNFKLVRGNGPGLGNSQLKGNGAAVYAIFDNGTKLHVTGAMAGELQNQHRWVEPEVWDQNTLDQTPPSGTLADVNGRAGALEVLWLPPAPAPAPTPDPIVTPPAAPVATPAPQPAAPVEFVWDRNGVARNLYDPSLHYDTDAERASVRSSVASGSSWDDVDRVGAIYDSGDPAAIDNWERFSKTGKYSLATPWGAEYNKAITEGYSNELATAWVKGKYPGMF